MIKLLPVLATLGKYRKSEGRTIIRWSFSDMRDSIYMGSFMLFTAFEKSIGKKKNILVWAILDPGLDDFNSEMQLVFKKQTVHSS